MKYTEIAVSTTEAASEIVADILTELTGEGVAVYDKKDFLEADWDYCDDDVLKGLSDDVIVKGFAGEEQTADVLGRLHDRFRVLAESTDAGKLTIATKVFDDGEWLIYRKKFFSTVRVGRIVICSADEKPAVSGGEIPVVMDIGMAFGTGEHETTRMCLSLGQTLDICGKKIADLGCGSGILGISFLKYGAKEAFFVDYDSQACEATKRNLALNGLEGTVEQGTLDKFGGSFDVVFANLTADIIEKYIDDILRYTKKGSAIVFSGILLERESDILSLCYGKNLDVKKIIRRGEWTAMLVGV